MTGKELLERLGKEDLDLELYTDTDKKVKGSEINEEKTKLILVCEE